MEVFDQRRDVFAAMREPSFGGLPVAGTFMCEDRIELLHRLERERRKDSGLSTAGR